MSTLSKELRRQPERFVLAVGEEPERGGNAPPKAYGVGLEQESVIPEGLKKGQVVG